VADEKEFSHVMKIDLQVHEVEEILESREDLEVQAVIRRVVKKEPEKRNHGVDQEVVRETNRESRKVFLVENRKEGHQAVLRHAPEVETEVEADLEVVQGGGEGNLIQEVEKDQIKDQEKVELEAPVENGKNRHIQIDQNHLRLNEMQSNFEKVQLLLER